MEKKYSESVVDSSASTVKCMPDTNYESHVVPDPSRPYICHFGHVCALPHWHENIEILCFNSSGKVICGRASYDVQGGDIAVIASNTLHAVPANEGMTYDCLIVDGAFLSKNNISVAGLKFTPIIRGDNTLGLYRTVMAEIVRAYKGDEYGAAAVKAAMLTLMVHICRQHSAPEGAEYGRNDAVKRALVFIKSHYSQPLSVDMIAGKVNISKYYFCREFRRETGFTVVRYINNLRCREAEKLLRAGKHTVSEAARACGFENLSYFTRTYKSIVGVPPSQTRA